MEFIHNAKITKETDRTINFDVDVLLMNNIENVRTRHVLMFTMTIIYHTIDFDVDVCL